MKLIKSLVVTLGPPHDKPWWWKHLEFAAGRCQLEYARLVYRDRQSKDISTGQIPIVMFKVLWYLLSWRRRYSHIFTFECDWVGLSIAFWQTLTGMRRPRHTILQFIMREKDQTVRSRAKYRFMRILFSSVHRVVVSSSSELEYYRKVFDWPAGKIAFVPLHTDPELLFKKSSEKGDFVLAAGRSFRDYDTLLRAIAGTNIGLLIVGGYGVTARYGGVANVETREDIAVSELCDLMLKARAIIIPLQYRAISTGQSVLLQAMALGKAVIATRTAGTIDYIDHMVDGLLVPPGDVAKLKEALLLLWNNKVLCRDLGAKARSRVTTMYLPRHYVKSVSDAVL